MICADCTEPTETRPCERCGGDALLDGRYRLEAVLGRGTSGVTWAATQLSDGTLVAIKAVTLGVHLDAKARELLDREVVVMKQLDHPAIPSLIDHFQRRVGAGLRVQYLVQDFVTGQTLAERMDSHRFDEAEVRDIVAQVGAVLGYLHGLSPPVIHRDLKPANLIQREDGRIALIDFGSVKDALSDPDLGGSTVAGTFGYMAPEQFRGEATPASDLYGLGATAVALLTRVEPRSLLDAQDRLDWRRAAQVSASFAALLDSLLSSDPADRSLALLAAPAERVVSEDVSEEVQAAPAMEEASQLGPTHASGVPWRGLTGHEPSGTSARAALPYQESLADTPLWDEAALDPGAVELRPTPDLPTPEFGRTSGRPELAAVAVVGAVLLFGAVTLISNLGAPIAGPEVAIPRSIPARCESLPCASVSDFHLRGLRLGQTVEEAKEAFPELRDAISVSPSPPMLSSNLDLSLLRFVDVSAPPDWPVYKVRTSLAGALASCTLSFADERALSEIDCTLDPRDSKTEHDQALAALQAALLAQNLPLRGVETKLSDHTGSLELRGRYQDFGGLNLPLMSSSSIELEVSTPAQQRAEVAFARAQRRAAEQARDAARAEQKRSAQQEIERLRRAGGAEAGGL